MNNKRGTVLIITLGFILVFTLFGFGTIYFAGMQNSSAVKRVNSNKAFWLAEAGLQKGIWEYNKNSCHGFFEEGRTAAICGTNPIPCVNTANPCANCTCNNENKRLAPASPVLTSAEGTVYGDYDIILDYSNSSLTAKGWYPERLATDGLSPNLSCPASSTCRLLRIGSGSPFKYAAFARDWITIANNVRVDSYNSSIGPYGGSNILAHGDVGTNGTSVGTINLGNGSFVNGDLSTGPGGTQTGCSTCTPPGSITTHENQVVLDPVIVPGIFGGSLGTLTINNNQTHSLAAGNYKYDAIVMKNNSTLNINGDVNLYITGSFTSKPGTALNLAAGQKLFIYIDGVLNFDPNMAVNNISQLPPDLSIYSSYTGVDGMKLSNNNILFAAIYAPDTNVKIINNGNFYGSVIGETIAISGSANSFVHFDQVLAKPGDLTEWSEL